MKPLIISLLTMLVCSVGWACENYESCLKHSEERFHAVGELDSSEASLRAIAFKLAEIEEKLDKPKESCWVEDPDGNLRHR